MTDFSISYDYCLYEPRYKAIKGFDFLKGFKRSVLIMMVCEDTNHVSSVLIMVVREDTNMATWSHIVNFSL